MCGDDEGTPIIIITVDTIIIAIKKQDTNARNTNETSYSSSNTNSSNCNNNSVITTALI